MSCQESGRKYPETRRDEEAVLSNTPQPVGNPYGWLENPDSEEVQEWVGRQNEVFQGFLEPARESGLLEKVSDRFRRLLDFPRQGPPKKHGERFYFYRNDGLQNQNVLYCQDGPDAPARVFLDPNALAEDGTTSLGASAFSEDPCRYFAYGVQRSGSDWQTIHVMDADSLQDTGDRCEYVKFSSIAWTHDSKGFFYSRYPAPIAVVEGGVSMGTETAKNQEQKLYYHVLGTAQSEDALVFEDAAHPEWMFGAEVSDDGKYLIVTTNYSCEDLNRVHLVSLEGASLSAAPVALVDDFVASFGYITNEGSVFYFQSNLDAPRGSLLSVDISDPAALCNPRGWKAVLPQHPSDVLSHVWCVNQSHFVVIYMKDVVDRLYLHALDGQLLSEITLPSLGCVSGLSTRKKDAFFYFKFTSFAYPGTIFRHDFGEPLLHTHYQTVVEGVSPADFVAEQEWFASKDGTKIPMFVVRHKDVPRHGQQTPAYLYGYGGFNISIQPSFSTSQLFFMQYFRGILAIANIRGGGEYGEEWHHAGVKGHKQNVFDDFCAAAEYLVATKATVPSLLTISGGSNGGTLVGACMNQRPELFGCCVAHVGVFDMLQFHRFTIGYAWTSDYGCADEPEGFDYLFKYSPLHNVKINPLSQYPALLLLTGDHDDRVVPLHSLKFAAALQQTLSTDPRQTNPLLLRVDVKSGHGAGKPISKTITETSEVFAFMALILNQSSQVIANLDTK